MKNTFFALLLFLTACASSKQLETAESCKVWKEEIPFGRTWVDVGRNGAYWDGLCKNLWWDCKHVSASIKESSSGAKEVFLYISSDYKMNWDQKDEALGIISGNEFNYNQKNLLARYISFTPLTVDSNAKKVQYKTNIHILGMSSEVNYSFNSHCSGDQALLGALAISAVAQLQNKKAQD